VKTVREVSTVPAPTDGDALSAVLSTPNTVHGWRPISVKIQPNEFAASGSTTAHGPSRQNQRVTRGSASCSRRVSHSPASPNTVTTRPSPIMKRNDQYVTGMFGAYAPGPYRCS
jgi:hypothetical protein